MYALDTNAVIHAFKGQGRVAERLLAVPPQEIGLPTVVLYELTVGARRASQPAQRQADLARFRQAVQVLPFTVLAAERAAQLRVELEAAGTPIGPLDTLIAGTALAYGAVLVTHNIREFSRIIGLAVEDWY